ncbi:MAG: hypothetical protein RMY34_16885 [Aulosira sp. DedQUE10]|nr:hypothetical protein [Aulosira sp. DedQUE10]
MIQQSEEKLTLATKLKNQELGVISLLLGGLQVLKANLIPIITIGLVINLPLIVISEKLLPIFTEQSGLAIISLYGQITAYFR